MKVFLTGNPGVGKSTVFRKVVEKLKEKFKVCGFFTPEVKEKGRRIGFKVIDLRSGKEEWLAKINEKGIPFGKYFVLVERFEKFLDECFKDWEECDLIAIDEIGKMEMLSPKFNFLIEKILNSNKNLFGVLHRNFVDIYGKGGLIFEVTRKNREKLDEIILKIFEEKLKNYG